MVRPEWCGKGDGRCVVTGEGTGEFEKMNLLIY